MGAEEFKVERCINVCRMEDMEQTIVGFILLVFGGLNAVRPEIMLRFQVWSQRAIMGAQYLPSARTYTVIRLFGALFIVLGLLVITGAIK